VGCWGGCRLVAVVRVPVPELGDGQQQRQQQQPAGAQQGVGPRRLVGVAAALEDPGEARGQQGGADRRADPLGGLEGAAGRAGQRQRHRPKVRVTFGEVTMPPPSPPSSSGPAAATAARSPPTCRSTRAVAASPVTVVAGPVTVSQRPTRPTSRPASTAETATPSANGVTARPDRSGEEPGPSWKNSASTSQMPVNPTK
jgi:hypothetical protein